MDPQAILENARIVLVIDWPSQDVPESLTRAGFEVLVKGGPGLEDYRAYELKDGEVVVRGTGKAPEHADIVYTHRPLGELPGIVALAESIGAAVIWSQSGRNAAGLDDPTGCRVPDDEQRSADALVRAAGLTYLTEPYIADVARKIRR